MILLIYTLLSIILYNKHSLLFSLFVIFLAAWIYSRYLPEKWWENLLSWAEWIILYIRGLAPLNSDLVLPTSWLMASLISLILFILTEKVKKIILIFCLGVSLLGTEWFLGHEQILPCMWLFALSLVMLLSSRHYHYLTVISSVPDYGLWMLWTLPTALIVVFMAFISMPQDTAVLKWEFLERQIDNIQDRWSERYGFTAPRQSFRLSQTGFSPSSDELGGPVQLSDEIVLEVKSPKPLYLRGTILNYYTGSNWINSINDKRYRFSDQYWKEVRDTSYDWDEQIWKDLDSSDFDRFFPSAEVIIHHVGIETSVIFNSIRCYNIAPLQRNKFTPYFNHKSETFTSRNITEEDAYMLDIRVPSINDPEFQQFINEYVSTSDMENLYQPFSDTDKSTSPKLDFILEHYTQIPDTVPSRVHDLAVSITKDLSNPFDKAKALEKYLKENFTYTLTPPYTPVERDFVDYFLFDLKKGYCTYFASAMAIMGRSIGLPTRYIEGFFMPQQPSSEDMYEVRKEHGHAWVEIYFPKVGWLPFDPTPSVESGGQSTSGISDFSSYYEDEYMEDEYLYPDNMPDLDISTSKNKQTNSHWWNEIPPGLMWIIAILIFIILIMLFLGGIVFWHRLQWYKIKKYPLDKQLILYYKEILWLLELYQFPVQPGETPYKYSKRVDSWLVNPISSLTEISHILIKTQFGSYPLKEEELSIVKQFYLYLEEDIKKVIGTPRYFAQLILRYVKKQKWGFVSK